MARVVRAKYLSPLRLPWDRGEGILPLRREAILASLCQRMNAAPSEYKGETLSPRLLCEGEYWMLLNRSKLLADRARFGRWSEKRCERFLLAKGLKTLTRNYRCQMGEIDIVMVDTDGSIVFVEVRSRTEEGLVSPEATITTTKRAHISQTARYFLATHKIEDRPLRFDVVTLLLGRSGPPEIQHYPGAFVP